MSEEFFLPAEGCIFITVLVFFFTMLFVPFSSSHMLILELFVASNHSFFPTINTLVIPSFPEKGNAVRVLLIYYAITALF